ncbi:MAG: hypothetical protein N2319_10810 [Candidatus Kapabacteria bacterium]|nr:hypothetical protein [Candidatus Kapabacteria bacterium]
MILQVKLISKLYIVLILLFAFHFSFAISKSQSSKVTINEIIFLNNTDKPKSFLEIIFQLKDSNTGTKIAPKKDAGKQKSYLNSVSEDTTKKENKITSVRESSDKILLYIDLIDYDQRIQISVFNLLGKKVLDVFEGLPYKDPDYAYEVSKANLPNGVYLFIVLGKNFKLREKFVISR